MADAEKELKEQTTWLNLHSSITKLHKRLVAFNKKPTKGLHAGLRDDLKTLENIAHRIVFGK